MTEFVYCEEPNVVGVIVNLEDVVAIHTDYYGATYRIIFTLRNDAEVRWTFDNTPDSKKLRDNVFKRLQERCTKI